MTVSMRKQPAEHEATVARPPRSRRRRRRALLIILAVLVLLCAAGGGYLLLFTHVQPLSLPPLPAHLTAADLGLARWRDYRQPLPADPLNDARLPASPQVDASLALLEDAAGQALIHQGALDRGLAYLRAAAQADITNLRYANDYRLALRDHGRYTDEESFFSQQAQQFKGPETVLSLALTYVDEMRSCPKPPDGLVCQAQDSSRSITVLDNLLAQYPYNLIARYARGLNHLYWPSLMGHLPKAQVDLQFAVALLKPLGSISSAFPPEAYAALGDVFAKDNQVAQARNIWLNGQIAFPNAAILANRLSIPQDQLVNEENSSIRGLGVYVETDIAIFWKDGK